MVCSPEHDAVRDIRVAAAVFALHYPNTYSRTTACSDRCTYVALRAMQRLLSTNSAGPNETTNAQRATNNNTRAECEDIRHQRAPASHSVF